MSALVFLPVSDRAAWDSIPDEAIVEQVRAGNTALYEVLMRRYNQRLFRIAFSMLRSDSEAEDVMQEAYVRAYEHLDQFSGDAKFSTWLTRIAINEALGRIRRSWRTESFEANPETNVNSIENVRTAMRDPERLTYDNELRSVLESAIGALPEAYRTVFVLRAVEGLSVAETATCLNIGEEAVKSRLHRARQTLQRELRERANLLTAGVFPFHLSRCDRIVNAVLNRIKPPA